MMLLLCSTLAYDFEPLLFRPLFPMSVARLENETITWTTGADDIHAGLRNDTIVSLAGNDVFIFAANFGHDTVSDFVAGAGTADVIDLSTDSFADYASVMAAATQVGADTLINHDPNNSILLKNVALANLHQDDFRFTAAA